MTVSPDPYFLQSAANTLLFVQEKRTSRSLILKLELLEMKHPANDGDSSHHILFIAIQGSCSLPCADQKNMWVSSLYLVMRVPSIKIKEDQRKVKIKMANNQRSVSEMAGEMENAHSKMLNRTVSLPASASQCIWLDARYQRVMCVPAAARLLQTVKYGLLLQ